MNSTAAETLCQLRTCFADRIGTNRYRTWFGDSAEFHLHDGKLRVGVGNPFVANWVVANFMPDLEAAGRAIAGHEVEVEVRVVEPPSAGARRPDAQRNSSAPPGAPPLRVRAAEGPGRPPLRGELDTFVVGASNQLAYSAALNIVHAPRAAYSPFFLHGGCGLGKTHLIQGICNGVRKLHPALEWRYLSGEEFTNEFIFAVKNGKLDAFRARFRAVDLLVIDDIHFLAHKKATQEEFLHTFNAIDACGKFVILTSDRHPRSIATLGESLLTRLLKGMVVEIGPPDFATRREILRRRAATMAVRIPPEVLDLVARHITRNVRELEGALYKLAALASLTREPLTTALAAAAIEDYALPEQRAPEAVDIERLAAQHFGVQREALRSDSRDRTVTLARAVAMHLIRKHTHMSFPEIGRMMGGKNHSTVLMAVQRVEKALAAGASVSWKTSSGPSEAPLEAVLAEIERRLGERPA